MTPRSPRLSDTPIGPRKTRRRAASPRTTRNGPDAQDVTPLRRRDEARALFRNAILDAAEDVFGQRGFHGARIQDIAARARMAVGTIYNHFGQKEDVLRALLEERTDDLLRALTPIVGDPTVFAAKLSVLLARMVDYIELHRGFFALAFEHGLLGNTSGAARVTLGGKPVRRIDRFRAALRKLVEEGISAGALEPVDPDLLARFLGSAIRTLTIHTLENPGAPRVETVQTVISLFLNGARRRRSSR